MVKSRRRRIISIVNCSDESLLAGVVSVVRDKLVHFVIVWNILSMF